MAGEDFRGEPAHDEAGGGKNRVGDNDENSGEEEFVGG